jgi:hypothetical protein
MITVNAVMILPVTIQMANMTLNSMLLNNSEAVADSEQVILIRLWWCMPFLGSTKEIFLPFWH